jgi:hypothetical protein
MIPKTGINEIAAIVILVIMLMMLSNKPKNNI